MLASQLINTGFPAVNLFDKVSFALQLMEDYDLLHLPVLSEEKFAGIIEKADLLDADEDGLLASLEQSLKKLFVKGEEHFLAAVKQVAENELSMLPVINEQHELQGIIPAKSLFTHVSHFLGNNEKGGVIVLETDKRHFSFGEISRLVETNDAYITQLNTYPESDTGLVIVTIKINKIEVSDIVATFQRYDYVVRYYFGEEQYANELKENYNHLLAYLNM
ncbi:CBS domain-containing protein [Sediminibacterium sp.]|jgi:acetoin utilization protein AcuB|uniref:CBS domain-containing protein n=1 Tax=Sediminibacterium sp. TaxID=1917865 RepID=UPI0025FB9D89|nr:CBS domain-containing protein [Sediminibacterium sp.]MBW0179160.1 CBS domain-containing protein [Sediminibacterium sp.]